MVSEFYYEDFSRQPRLWKKECTGGIGPMTKMKWPERTIREKTNHFKPTFYMKKTIIIIAAALFGCTMLGAQEKGEMTVGGTIGFSGGSSKTKVKAESTITNGDKTPSLLQFGLSGEFGWFFADNWRIGASITYGLTSQPTANDDGKWLKDKTNLVNIGPSISYFLRIADGFHYTPEFGLYGTFGNYKTDLDDDSYSKYSVSGLSLDFKLAAFEFRPLDRIAFTTSIFSISYSYTTTNISDDVNARISATGIDFNIHPTVGVRYYF